MKKEKEGEKFSTIDKRNYWFDFWLLKSRTDENEQGEKIKTNKKIKTLVFINYGNFFYEPK